MTREDKLIRRMEAGDRSAADELVRLLYPEILRYCLWHAPNRSMAEDAVQETFLKAVRYFDRYIHKGNSKKVYLFLLSKTNNEHLAEELTQETFFQAVQCIDRFKGNSSILTWLCGIAKNVWLKYLRKHPDTLPLEGNIPETNGKKEINVQWEQKEILQLIHAMNEPVREVMYLRLISNLSFAEIGEIIGKTESWTRVTFFRGKQKIVEEILKNE